MEKIFNSFYNSVIYDDRYKYIFEGLFHTILIALFAVIIGIIIGIVIAIIRNNYEVNKKFRVLNSISKIYVDIIRGTPVILQLMIIYYVIFKSVNINITLVGIIAFGINSGAHVSEIIRSGINSIDKGKGGKSTSFSVNSVRFCRAKKYSTGSGRESDRHDG